MSGFAIEELYSRHQPGFGNFFGAPRTVMTRVEYRFDL